MLDDSEAWAMTTKRIALEINGTSYQGEVPVRKTLADFIREDVGLTGTHLGCEHGVCGACTVLFNGESVRSCLMLAVQAHEGTIVTIEHLSSAGGHLHPIQLAFWENHGLQCGFCTPGMVLAAADLLRRNPNPTDEEIRLEMSGNICRCTGYHFIVDSVRAAAAAMRAES